MLSKLNSRWDCLVSDQPHSVFQLCDATHPMDFYIGKNPQGHRLLLLVTSETPPTIRDMRMISIRTLKREDGKWSLLLTLESSALAPMFSMLCNDLIESSRNIDKDKKNLLNFVLIRLSNWRRLFERGLPNVLTENEIRGLCGELLFLKRLFGILGEIDAVKAWVGPEKADQDFQTSFVAWEVKTRRPDAQYVTISSEMQLQTTSRPVQLVVLELADAINDAPGVFTLSSLVEGIRVELEGHHDAYDVFENRLANAGYIPRSEYNDHAFVEKSLNIFSVENSFPRITSDMTGFGISRVKYDILLSACELFRAEIQMPVDRRKNGTL